MSNTPPDDRTPHDSGESIPQPPNDAAGLEEHIRYSAEASAFFVQEQRRMKLQIKSFAEAMNDRFDALADNLAEMSGVLMRIESIALTTAAKQANHERESAPPTLDQLAAIRSTHDKQARALEKRAIRVDAKLGEHDREIAGLKADAKDTTRQAVVTAEHAIEVLAGQRDSALELVEHTRERVEEKAEANAEKSAHVIAAREGRRFEIAKAIGIPLVLVALGFLAGKLQACTGVTPLHLPAPAAAPTH